MKDEERWQPWDEAGGEAPEELVRALRALANERPSRAHLERLGAQLEAQMEGSPASTAMPALARGIRGKAVVLRLVIAALGMGGVALWLGVTPNAPAGVATRTVDAVTREEPPVPAALAVESTLARGTARFDAPGSAPEHDHRSAAPENGARAKTPDDAPASALPSGSPRTALLHRHEARSGATAKSRQARAQTATTVATATNGSATRSGSSSSTTQLAATAPAAVVVPEAPTPAAERAPPPPRKLGEVELLLSARSALKQDPQAALKLLDEHAGRFASGTLAPEREVLAIEALRQSGQTAVAEQRLRLFRAHYPNSLHLLRLQQTVRAP